MYHFFSYKQNSDFKLSSSDKQLVLNVNHMLHPRTHAEEDVRPIVIPQGTLYLTDNRWLEIIVWIAFKRL